MPEACPYLDDPAQPARSDLLIDALRPRKVWELAGAADKSARDSGRHRDPHRRLDIDSERLLGKKVLSGRKDICEDLLRLVVGNGDINNFDRLILQQLV